MGKGEFWEVWKLKVIMGDGNRGGLSGDHIVGKVSKLPHPELSFMRFLEELLANAEYQASGSRVLSCFSHVWLLATPGTVAPQAPLSMGFSRQGYWSGLLSPPPGDLPHPQWNLRLLCLLHWQVGSLPLAPPGNDALVSHFNFNFWKFSFFLNFLGHQLLFHLIQVTAHFLVNFSFFFL